MGIPCESCGKISAEEDAVYCKYCGFRYARSELEGFKNIYSLVKENQTKAEKSSKVQMRISYVSAILSAMAVFMAIGALLITTLELQADQRGIAIIIIFLILEVVA